MEQDEKPGETADKKKNMGRLCADGPHPWKQNVCHVDIHHMASMAGKVFSHQVDKIICPVEVILPPARYSKACSKNKVVMVLPCGLTSPPRWTICCCCWAQIRSPSTEAYPELLILPHFQEAWMTMIAKDKRRRVLSSPKWL